MPHYFASFNDNKEVIFNNDDEYHLKKVLRIKLNDEIKVVISNNQYLVKITNLNPLKGEIISSLDNESLLKNKITLFLCLIKGSGLDFILQKATELGIDSIYLVMSKRTVIKIDNKDKEKKINRYQKILDMASSQCQRNDIPKIKDIIYLKDINKDMLSDVNLLANEKCRGDTSKTYEIIKNINDESISIFIGCEGGFEDSEISYLESLDFKSISLGKRILRSDTASIYLLSVLSFLLENR